MHMQIHRLCGIVLLHTTDVRRMFVFFPSPLCSHDGSCKSCNKVPDSPRRSGKTQRRERKQLLKDSQGKQANSGGGGGGGEQSA